MRQLVSLVIGFAGMLSILQSAILVEARPAAKTTTSVTRDNFVSFEMQTSGGIANLHEQVRITGNVISFTKTRSGFGAGGGFAPLDGFSQSAPITNALSENQLRDLLRVLNETRFPGLVGKYHQQNLKDGINELVTLTLSDETNADRSFTVQNYGDTAPRNYYKVTEYLRRLQQQKLSPLANTTQTGAAPVTAQNFLSLAWENSGGIAGIRSLMEIRRAPLTSSIGGWRIHWSQTIGGRNVNREAPCFPQEISELIRLLTDLNLPALGDRKYRQADLADGFNEVLTLRLSDNRTFANRTFVIENYGDRAPGAYYKVTEFLRQLQEKKFPATQ